MSRILACVDWMVVNPTCCQVGDCLGKYDSNNAVISTASVTVMGWDCFTDTAIC